MKHKFDITNLGKMRYFLGLEVLQRSIGVFISQKKYALKVLQRFGMDRSNFVHNHIVPSFKLVKDEVSLISRYVENPTELYLGFGIFYRKGGDDELGVYIDSDYVGDLEDRKSTSDFLCIWAAPRNLTAKIPKSSKNGE
ncbi:hypothetical protein LWI29_006299 [Acer saccharum]|uniref:Mitochondrial protein n=1 Tax=Acer saccharum TaxID=4024 RepID=A0AA39SFH5_ACESA|nr:hypothetical protein LWI29_006299 [Acer saccharum]